MHGGGGTQYLTIVIIPPVLVLVLAVVIQSSAAAVSNGRLRRFLNVPRGRPDRILLVRMWLRDKLSVRRTCLGVMIPISSSQWLGVGVVERVSALLARFGRAMRVRGQRLGHGAMGR